MNSKGIEVIIAAEQDSRLQNIGTKIIQNERLLFEEGVYLFEHASLPYVGALANWKRESLHGNKTYFNRNFHI
jgi:aminodeoxyfutalosine synthase